MTFVLEREELFIRYGYSHLGGTLNNLGCLISVARYRLFGAPNTSFPFTFLSLFSVFLQ